MASDPTIPTDTKTAYPLTTDRVLTQLLGIKPMLDQIETYAPGRITELANQGIYAAVADFERDVRVDLTLKTIVTFPSPGQQQGIDYDLQEDQYDYVQMDYARLGYYNLRHRPIAEVTNVTIQFDTFNVVYTFPLDWIRVEKKMGRVSIVPDITTGNNSNFDYLFFLPRILAGFGDVIPTMVSIDYVAGIADLYTGTQWTDLRMWLLKKASLNVREACWEMLPQGGGIDGASASFAGTESLVEKIEQGWQQFKLDFGQTQRPIMMTVL